MCFIVFFCRFGLMGMQWSKLPKTVQECLEMRLLNTAPQWDQNDLACFLHASHVINYQQWISAENSTNDASTHLKELVFDRIVHLYGRGMQKRNSERHL